MKNNSKDNVCSIHKKTKKYICDNCNAFLCSRCNGLHLNENDHKSTHVDDAKQYFSLESNQKNVKSQNSLEGEEYKTWKSLQELANYKKILKEKENRIVTNFKNRHELLVIEEQRFKSPIITEIDKVETQFENQLSQFKSLQYIKYCVDLQKKNNNNNNSSDNKTIESQELDSPIVSDTTNRYSTEELMDSISKSQSLKEFLEKNNLISDHKYNNMIINHQGDHNDLILNSIYQYNQTKKLKDNLKISDQLVRENVFIFSINTAGKATIFNVTDSKQYVKQEIIKYQTNCWSNTYQSIVHVEENIYLFGGSNGKDIKGFDKYSIFSTLDKSMVYEGTMHPIKGASNISACYDGKDYIYLIGGRSKNNHDLGRIDIFNIRTRTFHEYAYTNQFSYHVSSYYIDGLIYIYHFNPSILFTFNPETKETVNLHNNVFSKISTIVCWDHDGNIYSMAPDDFQRFNVKTMKSESLFRFPRVVAEAPMQYSKILNKIFVLCGGDMNYFYSLDNHKWSRMDFEDKSNRTTSVIYQF